MIWEEKEMSAEEALAKVPDLYAGCPELCAAWQRMLFKKRYQLLKRKPARHFLRGHVRDLLLIP